MLLKNRKLLLLLTVLGSFLLASCDGCKDFGSQILYNQADKAHGDGNFEKAIRIYKKLLDEDPEDKVMPDNALVTYDLGVAYLDTGKRRNALQQIEKLKKMKRKDLADQLETLLERSNI